jgi:hypothetical protein
MTSTVADQTTATLSRHLQAFGSGSVDALLSDYTEESGVSPPSGTTSPRCWPTCQRG